MVQQVVKQLGGLDIAINNAGVNRNHAAEDCSEEDWDLTFGLNTKGVFLCCQAEGRHMLKQGASCFCYGAAGVDVVDSIRASSRSRPSAQCMIAALTIAAIVYTLGRGKIINTASMASLLVPHPQKQVS